MSKLFSLYKNEMYKTLKRVSILVFAILIIVGGILTPGIIRVLNDGLQSSMSMLLSQEDYMKNEISYYEDQIQATTEALEKAREDGDSPETIHSYSIELQSLQNQIDVLNYRIENEFFDPSRMGFLNTAFDTLSLLQQAQMSLAYIPEENRSPEWTEMNVIIEETIDDLFMIIDNKDFDAFIAFNDDLLDSPFITYLNENAIQAQAERLQVWHRIDAHGGLEGTTDYYSTMSAIYYYLSLEEALDTGVIIEQNFDGATSASPLSPEKEEELTNYLAVMDYRIDNNELNLESAENLSHIARDSASAVGIFLLTILAFIVAGSAVSQEIATGSIKSLIIAPVRRWKIFTAKYLSLLTVTILGFVAVWIFSNIGYMLFYGSAESVPYIYAVNGEVHSIPFLAFDLLRLFAANISVFVLMTFAFMLSVITRNTALSVGTALAVNFIVTPVLSIITQLAVLYRSWMDFIPFMNLNISIHLFPFERFMYSASMYDAFDIATSKGPSLMFSVIYLIILVACMFYIGFDSFTRRDIK